LVAAALVSISLNPLLYRLTDVVEAHAKRSPRLWGWLHGRAKDRGTSRKPDAARDTDWQGRAIVVGYGPVGRTLVRLLQENGIEPVVIELNLDTVHRLRDDGIHAIYGDATHKETVVDAGTKDAQAFILASSSVRGSEEAIRAAREVNSRIRVLARANYLREIPALRNAGADAVFTGEGEVALSMTESLMRGLGASGEQIDRESDRIREDLFGSPLAIEILAPPPPKNVDTTIERQD
jgi:CPA2 family monovalent cation:H+ antiporter-2